MTIPSEMQLTRAFYDDERNSVTDICRALRISRTTLYRYVEGKKHR